MHMHHIQPPQFRSLRKPVSLQLGKQEVSTAASPAEEFELEPPAIQFGDDLAILIESILETVEVDGPTED